MNGLDMPTNSRRSQRPNSQTCSGCKRVFTSRTSDSRLSFSYHSCDKSSNTHAPENQCSEADSEFTMDVEETGEFISLSTVRVLESTSKNIFEECEPEGSVLSEGDDYMADEASVNGDSVIEDAYDLPMEFGRYTSEMMLVVTQEV